MEKKNSKFSFLSGILIIVLVCTAAFFAVQWYSQKDDIAMWEKEYEALLQEQTETAIQLDSMNQLIIDRLVKNSNLIKSDIVKDQVKALQKIPDNVKLAIMDKATGDILYIAETPEDCKLLNDLYKTVPNSSKFTIVKIEENIIELVPDEVPLLNPADVPQNK